MNRFLVFIVALACLLAGAGCKGTRASQAASRGTLLICGGGVKDDNAAIYGRFIQLAGPRSVIGVVPAATGEDNPGQDTMEVLRRYVRPDQELNLLPIFKDSLGAGDDPYVVEQLRRCRALWFVGGDQSRITNIFRPATGPRTVRDTPAYLATLDVLARGGVIAGTSAGAAMMCDPMITGGTSADAIDHGAAWTADPKEGEGVGLARGMGYCTIGMIDQHFLERGRLGRLIVAMRAANQRRGFGVPENCALEVDRASGKTKAWGQNGVVEVRMPRTPTNDFTMIERRN